ncbi:uncharacterized protein LOC130944126 isoform X1 [Arachis stenosperma]|uniref:uncharacterized protein LOC130944126 isoform X1 n=1 Tax=Arachis stenosperma TaxID=217475 RepID=UPI0025ABE0C1|nr:uncharacterized protein LOC130944126 isoform X1 [Arachis stenosperma]
MTIPEKKPNKLVPFTEQDAARIAQRYDATTVLTLLQEVAHAQCPNAKIDWNELVKRTSTGISNAREYQMLWRHLAYGHALLENLENGAEPLDDDSDLEYEVEALPPISSEVASETVACVKVMIASLSESTPSSSTIEAPLTIHAPVCNSSKTSNKGSQSSSLMQGTEIIFPVTIKRQTLPAVSLTDNIESKGLDGSNMASKKRKIAWSEEEDNLLRDAVQRFGEGHWATIAKGGNFPVKRTAKQIYQRWNFLQKKDDSTNSGSILISTRYDTAEQQATRHSLSLALDMPLKKLTAPGMTSYGRTTLNMSGKNLLQHVATESSPLHGHVVPPQHPSQGSFVGSCSSSLKSTLVPEKPLLEVHPTPNGTVKGATIVSGAQIVSTSDSGSQVKVSHRNVVATTSSCLTKSSTPASLPPESKVQFQTDPSSAPVCTQSTVVIACPAASCIKPAKASSLTMEKSPEQEKHDNSVVYKAPTKQEVRVSNLSPLKEDKTIVMEITSKEVIEDKMNKKSSGNKSGNC